MVKDIVATKKNYIFQYIFINKTIKPKIMYYINEKLLHRLKIYIYSLKILLTFYSSIINTIYMSITMLSMFNNNTFSYIT